MLPARATETGERELRRIVAAGDRNGFYRIGHPGDCDLDEPGGGFGGGHARAGRVGQRIEQFAHPGLRRRYVEWVVAFGAEDRWEEIGLQLTEDDIAVRHRQRSAAPVTGWAGHCPGGFGADHESPAIEAADRSTARRDRMDAQHRHADAHARHDRFAVPFIGTGKERYVGRRATHVEADYPVEPGACAGFRHAHDATRRAGQDSVLATEGVGGG